MVNKTPAVRNGLPVIVPRRLQAETPQERYARLINADWRKSVEGIVGAGRWLIEAKQLLLHGEFGPMVEKMLDFDQRTAQRLMAVAENSVLANTTQSSYLPRDWTTLYELSKARPEVLEKHIADGRIRPDMDRKEAIQLVRDDRIIKREVVATQADIDRVVLPANIKVECRDARDHFPDELADLAIFSPPYPDAGKIYEGQQDALKLTDWLLLIHEAARVLADGWQVGRLCMVIPSAVGRSPYVPLVGKAWDSLERAGFAPEGEIVWDKATTGNRTTWGSNRLPTEPRLRDRHEVILIGRSKHAQRVPADIFADDGTGHRVSPWLDQITFLNLTQSVWSVGPESAQRVGHPAPFPPVLAEKLLRLYGWPGCTVIDPFAGSGSVGEAAKELGANAVLCDQSEEYCDLMRRRLGVRVAS